MSLYHRWRRERREIRRQNDKDERERRHNAVLSEKERELESHRAKIEISAGVIAFGILIGILGIFPIQLHFRDTKRNLAFNRNHLE